MIDKLQTIKERNLMSKILIRGNRYYKDELDKEAFDLIKKAFLDINSLKRNTYNLLYEKRYKEKIFNNKVNDNNYCKYLTDKFNINAYYLANSITLSNGILSSQTKLRKDYIFNKKLDIKKIKEKINTTKEKLDKKLLIKNSLIHYSKSKIWIKPYPKCSIKTKDHLIKDFKRKDFIDIDIYEDKVIDKDIKRLKHRIKLLNDKLYRENIKLNKLIDDPPKRVVFGSKRSFKLKDTINDDLSEYKRHRNNSVIISGRKDSKYGNFLVNYNYKDHSLKWKLPYGKEVIFKNFKLYKDQSKFDELFINKPNKAIAYEFKFYIDGNNREYIVPSVIIEEETDPYINYDYSNGAISIDINSDHIAYSEIDDKGNLIDHGILKMNLYKKNSNQAKQIINDTMAKISKLCIDSNKPLIMEDINTKSSKAKQRYEPKKKNRVSSLFAYKKITNGMISQSKKHKFNILFIDPSYTSFIGKIRYMRRYGLSIHEAASYTIGLKGLDLIDIKEVPEEFKNITSSISSLYKKINKFNKHNFYKQIPIFKNEKEMLSFFN